MTEPPDDGAAGPGEPDPMAQLAQRVRQLGRESEQLFERLRDEERRFRGLARAVWRVQEEERRRVARELHDGLGQTLTALSLQLEGLRMQLEKAEDRDLGAGLADAADTVRLALQECRELSRLLRPAVLDDLGLAAALSWLARTLGGRTGFAVELALEGLEERHSSDVETLVFRLAQEALTNVIRHAGVARATVRVVSSGGWIRLEVVDRGCGFEVDPALPAGDGAGSGLRGMRDRLALFGGRLTVRSKPGEGTTIGAVIPVEDPS